MQKKKINLSILVLVATVPVSHIYSIITKKLGHCVIPLSTIARVKYEEERLASIFVRLVNIRGSRICFIW